MVPRDAAALAWMANLGCLELHPHPVRTDDLDHPDELRVDLDPMPGIEWSRSRPWRASSSELLGELGLVGWPKTSGSRGIHVNVRIHRRWPFAEVRRAALALAREVEQRAPGIATSKWWKEERHGVFLDYNQNAKDRTVASAYSVRPKPDGAGLGARDLGRALRVPPRGVHAAHDARALRRDRRPPRAASTTARARSTACSSFPPATRRRARATRPGRRTTRSRRASRRACSRRSAARARRAAAACPRSRSSRSPAPQKKEDALAGLERWKARHPEAAARLETADVLVDSMRGRSSTWTRIRVNLEHVPEPLRPPQEPLDPDYDPWHGLKRRRV